MSKMTISGHAFEVPEKYEAGHVLNENEASQLNQTYREAIGNNKRKAVTEEAEKAEAEGRPFDQAKLQAEIEDYVKTFEFGTRRGGVGGGLPADPIEREATKMARDQIREYAKAKGIKKVKAEQINDLADQLLATDKGADIRKEAKRRVDQLKKISAEELDLSALTAESAE